MGSKARSSAGEQDSPRHARRERCVLLQSQRVSETAVSPARAHCVVTYAQEKVITSRGRTRASPDSSSLPHSRHPFFCSTPVRRSTLTPLSPIQSRVFLHSDLRRSFVFLRGARGKRVKESVDAWLSSLAVW